MPEIFGGIMKSYFSLFRRLVQLSTLGLFIWLLSRAIWPLAELPVDAFLRSDPLVALAVPLAAREFIAKLIPGLIVMASALAAGRFFCGWLCPMGTTLDLAGIFFRRQTAAVKSHWPAQIKFMLLAFILAAAALGLDYSFWAAPIPLITRFYVIILHPAWLWSADMAVSHVLPLLPADKLEALQYVSFAPRGYESVIFVGLFFLLLFLLEKLQPRFWCRNLCPAGALLAIISRRPLWRRRVKQCVSCSRCQRECPAGAISTDGQSASHGDCLTCQKCVDVCPARGVSFRPQSTPLPFKILESPPGKLHVSRRAFIGAAGLGLGVGWLHLKGFNLLPAPVDEFAAEAFAPQALVRPPGALPEKDFLTRCVRCGECLKGCPTNGLQPVWPGLAGLFTPHLAARKGPCEPDCNVCGQVCPTGAIAPLNMAEKRWAKMGTAVVLPETCLAWAGKCGCVICQEVCPYGAIELQVLPGRAGIPVPVVRPERCYGCGFCEYHCPVAAPAIVAKPLEALRLNEGSYQAVARAKGVELDLKKPVLEKPDSQSPSSFLE
ncbi:4Fe-4S ferredoxin [Deltaproteobacteria bacterium Smac51]|nr:4Fe-4S ferredoxin [Deltaproteobacteria bacterium Smac51]